MKGQIINSAGVDYVLTQNPYISDCGEFYTASAKKVKDDGCGYIFVWEVNNPNAEEECDMCNWDKFDLQCYKL